MGIEVAGFSSPTDLWGVVDLVFVAMSLVSLSLVVLAWRSRRASPHVLARGWYLSLCLLGVGMAAVSLGGLASGWRVGSAHGRSMMPTMSASNLIVVDSHAYGIRRPFGDWWTGPRLPARGDVVSFHFFVGGADRPLSKRVVGLPGDRVRYEDGQLQVNGIPVSIPEPAPRTRYAGSYEVAVREASLASALFQVWAPSPGEDAQVIDLVLPPGMMFVVGDNWAESFDSRAFGPVPLDALQGRVRLAWSGETGWTAP